MIETDTQARAALLRAAAAALAEGGADGMVVETMADPEEAKIALRAAAVTGLPVVGCMTFDSGADKDRTMMGTNVTQAAEALAEAGADMMGANCTLNSSDTIDLTKELRAATDRPLLVQPNAGKPVSSEGITYYEQTPAEFAADAKEIHAAGADMIGGCCGTTPEFIREVKAVLSNS